ncbi:cisplatin damage response ATP-dependent DNA ligase [Glaciecola sp. 2405UD65-10]|uniref:cisplatin damage response ATP-dependent DNA ligase n=1 Tax=Glaciecola sp. 2405UD65-10 TaxID=3397244 RepID=UPI003B5B8EB9
MQQFAELVDKLYFLNSNKAKEALLLDYFASASALNRGWALAAIAGELSFKFFKRKLIKDLITERVDPLLFDLSYDYVGEMSETVAHLWSTCCDTPTSNNPHLSLPSLNEVVTQFTELGKDDASAYLVQLLNIMTPTQRWALLKLGTKGLRIGVSARFIKKVLALYAQANNQDISIEEIERIWHGVTPPYLDLFDYLEGLAPAPDVSNKLTFQPLMLAHPIDEATLNTLNTNNWQAEWKFDGIRVQLLKNQTGIALYSRTGDDISGSFPDLLAALNDMKIEGRFDGELLALNPIDSVENGQADSFMNRVASFNQLQQRLNKKKPSKKLMQSIPVGIIVYDVLHIESLDMRERPLHQRIDALHAYFKQHHSDINNSIGVSPLVPFTDAASLQNLKHQASSGEFAFVEGLMLKHKQGAYISGRPKNQWYKLKRDPLLIDAVIMYAQRGHGKRSSFYSDFTFGCWEGEQLLPIGKAYSGFTDEELKKLDTWVRRNTLGRFGPVKEVKKELVFEVAFDSVHHSNRHKSKLALRFPRIHRIRWDKPALEADHVETLKGLVR